MKVSEETTALYPDVIATGSLANAVQQALQKLGSALRVAEHDNGYNFVVYARVEEGSRFSQIYIAAQERLFLFDLWNKGIMLAQGKTPDLDEMVNAIDKWISAKIKIDVLTQKFRFVTAEAGASAHEEGNGVEYRWQSYLKEMSHPELVDLVRAASKRDQLRSLFPFTSLCNLCFSRCTGYPYSGDLPYIQPMEDGQFRVRDHSGRVLGKGSVEEAINITIANLPANCGPAIAGTASDLDVPFVCKTTDRPET